MAGAQVVDYFLQTSAYSIAAREGNRLPSKFPRMVLIGATWIRGVSLDYALLSIDICIFLVFYKEVS